MLAGVRRSGGPPVMLWPAGLVVWGRGATSSLHAHHAVQLIVTLGGRGRLRGRARQPWIDFGAALIGPDVPHEVDARGTTVVIAFVDPESDVAAGLRRRMRAPLTVLPAADVAAWRRALGDAPLQPAAVEAWWRARVAESGPRAPSTRTLHPRVRRALRWLRDNAAATEEDRSLERMAALAGLSPSRFMHVFTQSLGVPLRPYVLWLRLQHAAGRLLAGASATEAAHDAGFSDAAHLSRTFRRTLGTTPREIAAGRAQGQLDLAAG
jgi:AraC-like DNA-binding protein